MKPLAYSYLRFSTPRQAKGDSQRRQLDAARMYAQEHGLSLQEKTFNDFGVSAFKGRNVQSGALGHFLALVEEGLIPSNSYLLVENHDRLSRMEPEEALHQLQSLVRAGIIVVTLHDREIYRRGEMDVMRLMKSIIYMERAHNESVVKSKRGKDKWEERRKQTLETGKLSRASRLPAWLQWDANNIVIDEERADVVRNMFAWYESGVGYQTIAKRLNSKGISTFRGGKEWRSQAISSILKNRAAIGEFQYHIKGEDGKRVPVSEVQRNLFPSIVTRQTYQAVQSQMRHRDNHPGQFSKGRMHNLFAHIIKCGNCGSPMTVTTKGKKTSKSPASVHFVCTRNHTGGGECFNLQWDSSVIEEHFKQAFPTFIEYYTRGDMDVVTQRELQVKLDKLEAEVEDKQAAKQRYLEAIGLSGGDIPSLLAKLKSVENEIVQLGQAIEDARAEAIPKIQSVEAKSERAKRMVDALTALSLSSQNDVLSQRQQFNSDLRSVFKSVCLFWCYDFQQGVMVFTDHYDREVLELQFQLGLEDGEALVLVEKVHDDIEFNHQLLGDTSEIVKLSYEFYPRSKVVKTKVERSKQALGAAKRRVREKTEKVTELLLNGNGDGIAEGRKNVAV